MPAVDGVLGLRRKSRPAQNGAAKERVKRMEWKMRKRNGTAGGVDMPSAAAQPDLQENAAAEKAPRADKRKKRKKAPSFSLQMFMDDVLSPKLLLRVLREQLRRMMFLGAVLLVLFMLTFRMVRSQQASTVMSLNYEESVTGKTPNGSRFSTSEFLGDDYLQDILQATGLQDDLTTEELADCLSITPTSGRLVTDDDQYYITSSYLVTVNLPFSLRHVITAQDVLKEVCQVYQKRFTKAYRVTAKSLNVTVGYDSMDYEEISSYFEMMAERIGNYLDIRKSQAGSYMSASGLTYSAIDKQLQNLQNYTLREYEGYIWENGVAKDAVRQAEDISMLNRDLRWSVLCDSQKSMIYMKILEEYDNKMVSSVLIPTYDANGSFYMSRTKVGIDDLALNANQHLDNAVAIQKKMETNESKLNALRADTTEEEQQTAQRMVEAIDQEIRTIIGQIEELDTDCYAQRISSYLVFRTNVDSFTQRYGVKKSLIAAVAVCVVYYLAVVGYTCRRRRYSRAQELL